MAKPEPLGVWLHGLLVAVTFTVLIGNADAHGKNIAFLHPTPESIELAPLYDTVPTVLWPKLRTRGAMSVGGVWELSAVTFDDLLAEAASWRHDRDRARTVVADTAQRLLAAAGDLAEDSAVRAHVVQRTERMLSGGG